MGSDTATQSCHSFNKKLIQNCRKVKTEKDPSPSILGILNKD